MKKNSRTSNLSVLVIMITVICCTFMLVACNACIYGGEHQWQEKTDWSWVGGSAVHKDPTCTEDGYTDYSCAYCSEEKREVIKAKGHKVVVDKARVEPTCTTDGAEEVSHCDTCKVLLSSGSVLPKTPHIEQKLGDDIAPTCTSTGLLAEIRCKDCDTVVRARQVLPMLAHTPVIEIPAVEATCVQSGLTAKSYCLECRAQISQQIVIPATGVHTYGDNMQCSNCDSMNPEFKAIRNAQDLQNINLDLCGKYYLANDIDLLNIQWEPIGSGYGVFTGVLDGNYHSISNLKISISNDSAKKNTAGGLIEKNSGRILNLTITNFSVSVSFIEKSGKTQTWGDDFGDVWATYGSFAGVNNGSLDNCTISGIVRMSNNRTIEKYFETLPNSLYKDHVDTTYSYFGGFVGVNSGIINNCVNSASFESTMSGYVQSMFGAIGGVFFDKTYSVTFYGDLGGIAGTNNSSGTISNCNIIGSFSFYSDLRSYCVKNTILLVSSTGFYCVMQNSMIVGSVVGTNAGKITGCKSIMMTIKRNHTLQGVTSKTTINDQIVNSGTSGFYGKNDGGTIDPIAII